VTSLLKVFRKNKSIKALAHITGGGFLENIPRVLPNGCVAEINLDAVPFLPVFGWLQGIGGVAEREMLRTFNCGIGMVIVVKAKDAKVVATALKKSGEKVVTLGTLRKRKGKEEQVATTGSLKVQ
jgi:phosphoribosylaminoimidazole (AIR) synthetase